jgi:hypothetical protein
MRAICKIYLRVCRRWGPRGMTISSWAWAISVETGNVWLRNRIDGLFLFWLGQANHSQSSYQREFGRVAVHKDSMREKIAKPANDCESLRASDQSAKGPLHG